VPILFIVALLVPLGLWMLWNGWSEGVGIRIAIGATFLFVTVVVFGALAVSSRMAGRRHRRRLAEGMTAEADLPLGGGGHRMSGTKAPERDDGSPAGDDAFDLDIGDPD